MSDPREYLTFATDRNQSIGTLEPISYTLVRNVEKWDTLNLYTADTAPALKNRTPESMDGYRIGFYRSPDETRQPARENEFYVERAEYVGGNQFNFVAYSAEKFLTNRRIRPVDDTPALTDTYDNLMKTFVDANLGPGAEATNRDLDGFQVEADTSRGAQITNYVVPYQESLFDVLNDLREASRGAGTEIFFRVLPHSTGWLFKTYAGYVGSDRRFISGRNPVILSERLGNFRLERAGFDASQEKNSITVTGGSGPSTLADATAVNRSMFSFKEMSRGGGHGEDDAAAESICNEELGKNKARKTFTGNIVEVDSFRYGVHWFLGDIFTAEHKNAVYTVMVRVVALYKTAEGKRRVDVRVEAL